MLECPREDEIVLVDWVSPGKTKMQQEGQLHELELEEKLNSEDEMKVHLKCTHDAP